ncbi:MAG: hypothetical protein ABJD11_16515, partial [Gemmatimonadota bacterium]
MILLLCLLSRSAGAQQPAGGDRARIQSLLAAEDARGKGADGTSPIVSGLENNDTLIRRLAVRAVGRLQRPDLAKRLVPMLTDRIPQIRAEVAIAMSQALRDVKRGAVENDSTRLNVRTAFRALSGAIRTESDDSVAGVIAEAMGRLPLGDTAAGHSAEQAILDRAGSRANFGMAHGLYWLGLARRVTGGLSPSGDSLLRRTARASNDPAVRRIAVLALTAAGALDSGTVMAASRDRDPQVRRLALAGVATLGTASRATLVRRAFADPSPSVRIDAVRAARVGSEPPDCALIERAVRDATSYVALMAIDALGSPCADSLAAREALRKAMTVPSPDRAPDHAWQRAAHALVALSRVDSANVDQPVARFARSTRWAERVYAATAAGNTGDAETLTALARDSNENVHEAAVTNLARTRKHEADSVYIDALASGGNQVLLAAAEALKGSTNPAALPGILDGFDRVSARRSENARDPRLAMLERIDEMGTPKDSARLIPYLADFDTTVAAKAATLLSRWTGSDVAARPMPLTRPDEPLAELLFARNILLRVTMAASSGGGSFTIRLFPDEAPATAARLV